MSTIKSRMQEQIIKHGVNLNRIFNTPFVAVDLCKKLFRLENKAHRLTEDECNTGADHEAELNKILAQVKDILFPGGINESNQALADAIFINGDPRGYTLKIKDSYVRENNLAIHTDFGGYGILAPEFNGK